MRIALVGEVRTAEFALRGMLRAGHRPCVLVTTDVDTVRARSGMAAGYYADLPGLGRAHDLPVVVIDEAAAMHDVLADYRTDYAIVLGWPYLVRAETLELVPCIGMHPSRLPARRGGAPLNWTILDGERSSAVSLLRLRQGLDDGEILAQRDFPIGDDEYVGDVLERALAITEDLVAESVSRLLAGSARWEPQEHALATYTRRRTPDDGRIDWSDSAVRIRNLIRATSHPFPGAFASLAERTLRVWRADLPVGYRAPLRAVPGTIVGATDAGILVSTRDNALLITEAQLDGEEPLRASALTGALAGSVGAVLDAEAMTA